MPPLYKSLAAWRHADDLFLQIHQISKTFPADERYVLTTQLRRAALSVPTNIVEGNARFHPRERLQFLRTAWSSLAETEYLLSVASRLSYVPPARMLSLESSIAHAASALRGLIAKFERTCGGVAAGPAPSKR
jgi:four helix bundle protein